MRPSLRLWTTRLIAGLTMLVGVGCSIGELEPQDGAPEESSMFDGGVIGDALVVEDARSDDSQEPDSDDGDPIGAEDEGGLVDSGVADDIWGREDTRGPDISDMDSSAPDVAEPEPDVRPDPCPRVEVIESSGAEIRDQAKLSGNIVVELGEGSVLEKLDEVEGDTVAGTQIWYHVASPGGDGFVAGGHVRCTDSPLKLVDPPEPEPEPDPCPRVKITAPAGVIIRSEPGVVGYEGTICHNSVVKVVDEVEGENIEGEKTWYKVQSPNGNGYITGKYAECTTASAEMVGC